MGWIIYAVVVLAISGLIGMHLGRFREVYTEMLGMMVGMTMGMLNGFLLGYAAAAVTNSMFWGNLAGILLGLVLGVYFGRPGGLMGVMDGSMGGVMGGSMGAMLSVMVAFPRDAQVWTGALLGGMYVAGMGSLVVLIERSAPGHAAFHRLTPFLARAISMEIAEAVDEAGGRVGAAGYPASTSGRSKAASENQERPRRLVNYYALLGVPQDASSDDIAEAYLARIDNSDDADRDRLERALAALTDSKKRETYDFRLAESQSLTSESRIVSTPLSAGSNGSSGRADCCPPPKQKKLETGAGAIAASLPPTRAGNEATAKIAPQVPRAVQSAIPPRPAGSSKASQGPQGDQRGSGVRPGGSGAGAGGSQNNGARGASPAQKQGGSKQAKGGGQRQSGGRAPQKQQVRYSHAPQERRSSPISWVGGLAALVILVALGWGLMTAAGGAGVRGGSGGSIQSGASGQTLAQLDAQAVVAPVGTDGKQTMDVVLDSAAFQYKPSVIKVKQGVPVHFNLSVINGDPG